MGGPGSGRTRQYPPRRLVEDTAILDVNHWMKMGIVKSGLLLRSSVRPTDNEGDWTLPDLEVEVDCTDMSDPSAAVSRLDFKMGRRAFLCCIHLTTTEPYGGGVRWWFMCPLVREGVRCERRVAKLYFDPRRQLFGCRQCLGLAYGSTQY
jgi:hypothetical protein